MDFVMVGTLCQGNLHTSLARGVFTLTGPSVKVEGNAKDD